MQGRDPPRLPGAGVHDVDLVADAPVRGERDLRAVRAPVRVAHDRVGAVAHEQPRGAAGAGPEQQRLGAVLVGQERERPPVRRLVHLVFGRVVRAHAPRRPALRGHLPDLPLPAAIGGEEDGAPVVREARQHVVGGIVGEPPGHAARRGDRVEVLVAADDLVVDQRPGAALPRRGAAALLRRGRAPAAAREDDGQEQPQPPPAQRSSSVVSAAASVPLARATSVVLMRSSRSPSRTRSTSPTSYLVRWSLTSGRGGGRSERIWLPKRDVLLRVLDRVQLRLLLLQLQVVEAGLEHLHGHLAVADLAALVLAGDHDAGGQVGDAHRGVGHVDVLAARAARAVGVDAQVLVLDLDLDVLVDLRPGEHGGEGGVAPGGGIEGADAHEPVHADLRRKVAVGVFAAARARWRS